MNEQEIETMLANHCRGQASRTQGLPELEDRMRDDLERYLQQLHYACRHILQEIPDVQTLEEQRPTFTRLAALLKLAAVSSINLLDAQAPSLPELTLEESFEVETNGTKFIVF